MKKYILILLLNTLALSVVGQSYNSGERGGHMQFPQTQSSSSAWYGSSIAIGSNYFVTNNHVVAGATHLYIYFPEKKKQYRAEVVATDATRDLAIVRITDPSFPGCPTIKYGFKTAEEDVGTDIFVLGYPMTSTMGEEVKLTTGVVSSRSGFEGDVSEYQVSAPIQSGNSGGPLFNDKGELIGIIAAKHRDAENVSYGVKLKYLNELISRSNVQISLNKSSQIASLPLSEKCKSIIPCTAIVQADNRRDGGSSSQTVTPPSRPSTTSTYPIRVNYPEVSRKPSMVEIVGIEITASRTAIYMSYHNTSYQSGYYYVDKNIYIVDKSTGKRYSLTSTENCAISPNKTSISFGEVADFVLYFPALPETVSAIDLIEPASTSTWKFYGIRIR